MRSQAEICGPYPPQGFIPFVEGELGNGDTFGLYWPFGKEASAPIVCEVWHDSRELCPAFSSVAAFLRAMENQENSDDCSHPENPTLDQDEKSPIALFAAARADLATQDFDKAASRLKLALSVLPEYTIALEKLAGIQRAQGEVEAAIASMIMAIVSPSYFGSMSGGNLGWFQRVNVSGRHSDDPIWQRRSKFSFKYGGTKANDDYDLYEECIREYVAKEDGLKAVLLHQKRAFLLTTETVSFQERYGFSKNRFRGEQSDLFSRFLKSDRKVDV